MPVKLDMTTAQPIQQSGAVTLDMSTAQPISEESLPPLPQQSRLMQSLSPPRSFSLGPGQPEKDPDLATAGAAGIALGAAGPTVAQRAAPYILPAAASYLINKARDWPIVGPIIEKIPMAEMLPWLFEGKPKKGKLAEEFKNPGAHLPEAPTPEYFQGRGLREGGKPGVDPAAGLGNIPVRGSIAEGFKNPGAPLPEAPPPEYFQGRGLREGGKPGVDPAAGLAKIPVRGSIAESMKTPETTPAAQQSAVPPPAPAPTPQPSPRPVARGSLNKMMDQELGKALGAKPLDPKVPLRKQMPGRMPEESDVGIPEGHTPVESSALKSYKYDPAAREFHARATSGNTVYIYGDVSPEEAAAFEAAESKGKAWQGIRRNPLVAKIVDGKRMPLKIASSQ